MTEEADQEFDAEFADELIGKTILVGLTYVEQDDTVVKRQQKFGKITSCDPESWIVVEQEDGETFEIAPIMDAIEYARAGIYRLKGSGREIQNPDFVAQFTIRKPVKN